MKKSVFFVTAGVILILLGAIAAFVISPKETPPFVDSEGQLFEDSIAEIQDLVINGVAQRILIRGQDQSRPILLVVHGGPGAPDQVILRSMEATLEDLFTVVYWDQRGAGASYVGTSDQPQSITLQQIVSDGLQLTSYLRERFKQPKIYLQGHSWGSLVGVHMVSEQPTFFHAYFGVGQMANMRRSESLSYAFALDQASQAGDEKSLKLLQDIGAPPYKTKEEWLSKLMTERGVMQQFERPDGSQVFSMFGVYKMFGVYPEYSLSDKLNSLAASDLSMEMLWMEAVDADLFTSHSRFDLPVYIFQGLYDKHTVTEVAKDYYDAIEAPQKKYFSFEKSAHWPHINEYKKYKAILSEIVNSPKL